MEEKKTLSERLENDILTDNTNIENCRYCKSCIFKDKRGHDLSRCLIYMKNKPYGEYKPVRIIDNGLCEFYRKE